MDVWPNPVPQPGIAAVGKSETLTTSIGWLVSSIPTLASTVPMLDAPKAYFRRLRTHSRNLSMYRMDCSCYTEQGKCRYNVEPQTTPHAQSSLSIFGPWCGAGRSFAALRLPTLKTPACVAAEWV